MSALFMKGDSMRLFLIYSLLATVFVGCTRASAVDVIKEQDMTKNDAVSALVVLFGKDVPKDSVMLKELRNNDKGIDNGEYWDVGGWRLQLGKKTFRYVYMNTAISPPSLYECWGHFVWDEKTGRFSAVVDDTRRN